MDCVLATIITSHLCTHHDYVSTPKKYSYQCALVMYIGSHCYSNCFSTFYPIHHDKNNVGNLRLYLTQRPWMHVVYYTYKCVLSYLATPTGLGKAKLHTIQGFTTLFSALQKVCNGVHVFQCGTKWWFTAVKCLLEWGSVLWWKWSIMCSGAVQNVANN